MATDSEKSIELTLLFRRAISTGDSATYTQFLQRIIPILRRMIIRTCAESDLDDVVQEIVISIHKARHTYDGQRPLLPWLTAIAKFRINDHLRKHYTQRRDKTVNIEELEEFLPDVTQEHTDDESIDELLEGITEKHKQILTLMHVEGYTAKQVGIQMQMNESAVKVAAHRSLKKLRKKFWAGWT